MRLLPILLVLTFSTPALADHEHGHGRRHTSKHAKLGEVRRTAETPRIVGSHRAVGRPYYFTPGQVQVIHAYYAPRYRSLPPGLQKKLYRTGQLPPGWQKRFRPFPVVVERQLAPLPRYYRRGVLDNYAVVYDPRRHVVIDVAPLR